MPPETLIAVPQSNDRFHKPTRKKPKNATQLFNALEELLEQLELIGIPEWHGAEGLSLLQAKRAIKNAKKTME